MGWHRGPAAASGAGLRFEAPHLVSVIVREARVRRSHVDLVVSRLTGSSSRSQSDVRFGNCSMYDLRAVTVLG